jgi:KamA family protein
MENRDTRLIHSVQKYSKREISVALSQLRRKAVEFLEHYATPALTNSAFVRILGSGKGIEKLNNLLAAAGFEDDDYGFFSEVTTLLSEPHTEPVSVNGLELPYRFLMALLEVLIPGHGFVSIKDSAHLTEMTNVYVAEKDRKAIDEVIEMFPVRLSFHTIRQMMISWYVAYQYLPFLEELDPVGHKNTWIGQFHQGLLEQMYQNRVIFLLNMSCPVYCRFCFRKHKDSRNEQNPTAEDVQKAIEHVASSPSIKEIVVTGGDPFLSKKNMMSTIDGLMHIPHVQTIRLATRSVAYYPDLFLKNDQWYLKYLKEQNMELQMNGKRLEVATHFIHPDEVSPESLEIITELVNSGIAVYIQTPFLKDCNDKGPELKKLYGLLRGAGAEMHYIYIPCSPIHGNSIYWTTLAEGIDIAEYLRAHLSDRSVPRICTATPIGKIEWYTSGWAVEPVEGDDHLIWIRTPYTPEYFKSFAPLANELPNIRVNAEGTLDIQYMADIGKEKYFLGSRPLRIKRTQLPLEIPEYLEMNNAAKLLEGSSIVDTGLEKLKRVHETRVQLSSSASEAELEYIKTRESISDVVIIPETTIVEDLHDIEVIADVLRKIPHVTSLRLRSLEFNYAPDLFTSSVITRLGDMNTLTVTNPLRVELESWFINADQLREEHTRLTRRLANKGITVYCNTPLYGGVNDSPDIIQSLTYGYRKAGIEFHHLYIAGLPSQNLWNSEHPIDLYDIVDIASKVRREGSGREGPRYILQTPLGEVYYGLTSSFETTEDGVRMKCDSYDLSYYQEIEPDFILPEQFELDGEGKIIMSVAGLINPTGFRI